MSSTTASESRGEATVQDINSGFLKNCCSKFRRESLANFQEKYKCTRLCGIQSAHAGERRPQPSEKACFDSRSKCKTFPNFMETFTTNLLHLTDISASHHPFRPEQLSASSLKFSLKHASASYGGTTSTKMWTELKKTFSNCEKLMS